MDVKTKIFYILCMMCLLVGFQYLSQKTKEQGAIDISKLGRTSTQQDYREEYREAKAITDITQSYLIPPDSKLYVLNDLELTRIYWRYVNTLQVLCRNQTRIGTFGDGGKEVCIDNDFLPNKPCIVYSFGSNFNFDFEKEVNRAFGCEIHTFDPTVKLTEDNKMKIPEYTRFHLQGLAGRDYKTGQGWPMATLKTIIKELNHEQRTIDLLKMDIEGWEYSSLDHAMKQGTMKWVKQLVVEIHFQKSSHQYKDMLAVLRGLYEHGFRIFMRDRNPVIVKPLDWDYTSQYTPLVELALINVNYRKQ